MRRALTAFALAVCSVLAVGLLHQTRFFRLLELKAYDLQFLWRGQRPTSNILLVLVDQKTLDRLDDPLLFWHPHYARAIRAAAQGGAKVFGLDVFFAIPVDVWQPRYDSLLAGAAIQASAQGMPVVCVFVPGAYDKQKDRPVPLYVYAPSQGLTASAHLRADPDDFIRRQQLLEEGDKPLNARTRSLGLRIVEKYLGQQTRLLDGQLYIGNTLIPTDRDKALAINYAGPAGTFPRVSLADFLAADDATVRRWVEGKIVLLGFDTITNEDRHATPFYTLAPGLRANTAGIEIHASMIDTILQQKFLAPPPLWVTFGILLLSAGLAVIAAWKWRPAQALLGFVGFAIVLLFVAHGLFRAGIVLPTARLLLSATVAAIVALLYRTETRRAFFTLAFSMFVGKRVARSLENADQISIAAGVRQQVTVLFSDIRGFTAFCDEKDAAFVVQELNQYLTTMVEIIMRHGGEVNKFIGDGILAVFGDSPDHAARAVRCGVEMVQSPGRFHTRVGIHTGEVIIGNVGSYDKLENTVLGATVNVASRLEGLNKEMETHVLISEDTHRLLDGSIPMIDLGPAKVRGRGEMIRVFTPAAVSAKVEEAGSWSKDRFSLP